MSGEGTLLGVLVHNDDGWRFFPAIRASVPKEGSPWTWHGVVPRVGFVIKGPGPVQVRCSGGCKRRLTISPDTEIRRRGLSPGGDSPPIYL